MTTQPNPQVSAAAALRHEELLRLIRQFDDEIGLDVLSEVITELFMLYLAEANEHQYPVEEVTGTAMVVSKGLCWLGGVGREEFR